MGRRVIDITGDLTVPFSDITAERTDRGISPVVGAVLMIVLTLLLATVIAAGLSVDLPQSAANDVVEGDLGDDAALQEDLVVAEDPTAGADDVVHATVLNAEDAEGEELESVTVEYPKEAVDLDTAKHEEILTVGVDTDADGDLEETFGEGDISGVNTNDDDSVLTVTFETGYELRADDRVHLRYGAAENPDSAGEYDVSARVNDAAWVTGRLVIDG
ncbi:type IV pilin N-terminal domain-containing protein [Halobellus ordinarius]|uniref:type IV pilin N-terminal domain-containing protein n=1 Tax=Halobellus ordinarius TaxID=3075120 RepID=UPI0028809C5F|nr:type IV pilin N-terminal domain-containing protein [Halobellus sp. ZY16]